MNRAIAPVLLWYTKHYEWYKLSESYYQLVEKELRYLLTFTDHTENDKAQVNEFLDHNELGLAFETLKAAPRAESKPEITAQIEILDLFLSEK